MARKPSSPATVSYVDRKIQLQGFKIQNLDRQLARLALKVHLLIEAESSVQEEEE